MQFYGNTISFRSELYKIDGLNLGAAQLWYAGASWGRSVAYEWPSCEGEKDLFVAGGVEDRAHSVRWPLTKAGL